MQSHSTTPISVGQRFGRWIVTAEPLMKRSGSGYSRRVVPVRCSCGTERSVPYYPLMKGESLSCGCLHYEQHRERVTTHGGSGTRLHRIWQHMRERCRQPTSDAYANYGGRGITICPEWSAFSMFRDWALNNGYSSSLTLDRIDNDGPYSPENCRWATRLQQNRNKRDLTTLTAWGETKLLVEWADDPRCTVAKATLRYRIHNRGLTPEIAMTKRLHAKK